MSCENKDRKRNRILNFRVSEEELRLRLLHQDALWRDDCDPRRQVSE